TAFEIATPAFFKAYGDQIAVAGGVAMAVRLRRGLADFPAFRAAVARISPEAQIEPGSDDLTAAAKARRATRLEALALLLFAILAAWRGARTIRLVSGAAPEGAERPSRVADRLGQAGLPPSTVVGVRMALEPGRGATAVPVRTTLVSAVMAVAVLVGTLSFGASLGRLATRPLLQGWNWDVSVGNPHSDDVSATAIPT